MTTAITTTRAPERAAPQNAMAERTVACATLLNPMMIDDIRLLVSPDMFSDPEAHAVFSAACTLSDGQKPIDRISVATEIRRDGHARGPGRRCRGSGHRGHDPQCRARRLLCGHRRRGRHGPRPDHHLQSDGATGSTKAKARRRFWMTCSAPLDSLPSAAWSTPQRRPENWSIRSTAEITGHGERWRYWV